MTCRLCDMIKNCKPIFERDQYIIFKYGEHYYCALKEHREEPTGCKSCIKGYMRESLLAKVGWMLGHDHFWHHEGKREDGHLYNYIELFKGAKNG